MSILNVLNAKTAKTTFNRAIKSRKTSATDLTDSMVSGVVNFYEEGGNPALCAYYMNQFKNEESGIISKDVEVCRQFLVTFVGMKAKKDDSGQVLTNQDGIVYEKNETKVKNILKAATDEGVDVTDKSEVVEWIKEQMEAKLAKTSGSLFGTVKRDDPYLGMSEDEVKAAKHAKFIAKFTKLYATAINTMSVDEMKAASIEATKIALKVVTKAA